MRATRVRIDQYVVIQSCLSVLAFFVMFVFEYSGRLSNFSLSERLTRIPISDPPWLPFSDVPEPILGVHFFGDWLLQAKYSLIGVPYTVEVPSVTPPFGLLITATLVYVAGLLGGLIIVNITCIIVWHRVISSALTEQSLMLKTMFFVFCFFMGLPFIGGFDRGSLVPLAYGLIGLSYLQHQRRKKLLALILFVVAVSLKPYLFMFTVLLIARREYSAFLRVGLLTVSVNLISLFFYSENILKGIGQYVKAASYYTSESIVKFDVINSISPIAAVARVLKVLNLDTEGTKLLETGIKFYFIISIVLIVLCFLMLVSENFDKRISISFIILSSTIIVPVGQVYVLSAVSLAILAYFGFGQKTETKTELQDTRVKNLYGLVLCLHGLICLTPLAITFPDPFRGGFLPAILLHSFIYWIEMMLCIHLLSTKAIRRTNRKASENEKTN